MTLWVEPLEPKLGGIGRYTWELAKGLGERREIGRLRLYARQRLIDDPKWLLSDAPLPPIHRRFGRLQARWEKWGLRNDLFHGPNFFLPPWVERGVITVHDLSVLLFPETHPQARIDEYAEHFDRSVRQARHIITVSETVRGEVIRELGVAPERVTTVHNGVSSHFRPLPAEQLQRELAPLQLTPGNYGLCVAALEPRKKLLELIDAWGDLPRPLRERYPLVLAGVPGWRNAQIKARMERGIGEGWLRPLGFVEERRLPALYAGARLFVYPSVYEGFGLPPLEAMASGVPVIVSNRSCLPEVCGSAAALVDPDDFDAFRSALVRGLRDEEWRAGAIARGLDHSTGFSWERCVAETVAVYRRALADG